MVAEFITKTQELWETAPEKAKGRPTVTARSERQQAVLEAGSFSWKTDLPPSLGGTNQSASPTAMLLGALAGCAVVFIKDTLAPQLGVQIDAVRATVSCNSDARGLLGMEGALPDLSDVSVDLQIESPAGEAAVRRVLDVWRLRCPVYLGLTKPMQIELTSKVVDPYASP
jgi:uncharacterized OsmC-like protein